MADFGRPILVGRAYLEAMNAIPQIAARSIAIADSRRQLFSVTRWALTSRVPICIHDRRAGDEPLSSRLQ
jgi:hypothetical protein